MAPKNGNYIFSEACTSWLIGICKKNYKKGIFVPIIVENLLAEKFPRHILSLVSNVLVPNVLLFSPQAPIRASWRSRLLENYLAEQLCQRTYYFAKSHTIWRNRSGKYQIIWQNAWFRKPYLVSMKRYKWLYSMNRLRLSCKKQSGYVPSVQNALKQVKK